MVRAKTWVSDETPFKAQQKAEIDKLWWRLFRNIKRKHGSKVALPLYVETHAGPGVVTLPGGETVHGGALSFREAAEHGEKDYYLAACERDFDTAVKFCRSLGKEPALSEVCSLLRVDDGIYNAPWQRVLPKLQLKHNRVDCWRYGMLFYDPQAYDLHEENGLAVMQQFTRDFPMVDLLFYVAATQLKRTRGYQARTGREQVADLATQLLSTGKKVTFIRELRGAQHFTFVLQTGWYDFPEWRTLGFRDLRTEEGYSILERAAYSEGERNG